ncbi:hypothetical protein SODALDRAFT_60489 [Sodiomyces alkalinus F11]|uniref:Uncharacterized protein n=1 Tax=Sodiomyces alkalinus (strain CBS 110278 / VKM F-3762 / F11) TaxID=1314773 RepID=A0A3N2PLP7_SODAK|nr:hypothetical protein SODALDRAFT_60489 [Sodiomyces alkalinus F11]ROT35276.1 hypothetical protein SODALDRAFT_60489 [Sodiomyces alkalinus F11]
MLFLKTAFSLLRYQYVNTDFSLFFFVFLVGAQNLWALAARHHTLYIQYSSLAIQIPISAVHKHLFVWSFHFVVEKYETRFCNCWEVEAWLSMDTVSCCFHSLFHSLPFSLDPPLLHTLPAFHA